jgi:putative phosphoesterase
VRIVLLSDTHSFLDDKIRKHVSGFDEIWHAGDIGSLEVLEALEEITTVRAVFGNIDGAKVRRACPEKAIFTIDGLKVFMIHIGGYPPRYVPGIKELLDLERPKLFISGHSHILKVMHDKQRNILHMNPGAAGIYGMHKVRTLLRFEIENGQIMNPEVVELGERARN